MAYTEGPWDVDDDTLEIFSITPGHSTGWIAKVLGNDDNGRRLPPEEMAANARLIAAAPDLLAALEAWMYLESGGGRSRPCYCNDPEIAPVGKCYVCVAAAAIEKAGGKDAPFTLHKQVDGVSLHLTTDQADILRSALADYANMWDRRASEATDPNDAAVCNSVADKTDEILCILTAAEGKYQCHTYPALGTSCPRPKIRFTPTRSCTTAIKASIAGSGQCAGSLPRTRTRRAPTPGC